MSTSTEVEPQATDKKGNDVAGPPSKNDETKSTEPEDSKPAASTNDNADDGDGVNMQDKGHASQEALASEETEKVSVVSPETATIKNNADSNDDDDEPEKQPNEEKATIEDTTISNDTAAEGATEKDAAEEDQGDRKKKAPPAPLPSRPIKRARTAYFIFTEEKRPQVQAEHVGEGVAAVAKVMGQMWGAMSDEEKGTYQQKAAEERERVAKELEAWKAAGGQIEVEASGGGNRDPNALIFPVGRVRKICKLDPEVKGMSKEAIMLITKCAELATSKLGVETVRVAQLQNRRKLLPEDVANVCSHREQFLFLKDDVKDLLRSMVDQSDAAAKAGTSKKSDAARDAAAAGSKPLTSYFGSTAKS